jgi:hypothetical protein
MPRKPRNPNWGSGWPTRPSPSVPSAFEEQVQKLGLNEQTCATSEKLKQWCKRNKDRCYIPEWLLKQWGIPLDPNVRLREAPDAKCYDSPFHRKNQVKA